MMSVFRSYLVNQTSYLNRIHPFFLNDFSTKVAVPETKSTGQQTTKRAPNSRRMRPSELTERSHHARDFALAMDDTKETRQIRSHPTIPVQLSTSPSKSGEKLNPLRPVSHRTGLHQTVIVTNKFNFKRSVNSPSYINQYNFRGTYRRVRRHRATPEASWAKENRRSLYTPSWNTRTPRLWCTPSPKTRQTLLYKP